MSERLNFGIFNDFWNGHPNHLPFLNLYEIPNPPKEWNLNKSIDILDCIVSENSGKEVVDGIKLLLKSQDWRPHLVASLATLKIDKKHQHDVIKDLWNRLKSGSWVSPQILVILSIIDSEFDIQANEISKKGFKITYSEMPMHEHHSSRGPVGITVDNKKVIASIEYLLNGVITDSIENDNGGSISKDWKENLLKLIENKKFT
ncbi:hypothetical protein [Nonlabens sp. Asnod2-A12]|uniref:hypothetical protein n=1 Tax=Nonlabens sp. Asnod2-A12 TaxID=3160578 RepID=UPI0038677713